MSRDQIFSDRDLADFLREAGAPERLSKQAFDLGATLDGLKTEAVDGYHQVDQSLGGYGKTLIGGLAGAAAGGGALYFGSDRRDGESDEEFQARRRQNVITGAIGGGALGGAVPTVASAFGAGKEPGMLGKAWDYMNPMHNRGTGTVAGAGAGALAGGTVAGAGAGGLNKVLSSEENKSPVFKQENSLPDALVAAEAAKKNAPGPVQALDPQGKPIMEGGKTKTDFDPATGRTTTTMSGQTPRMNPHPDAAAAEVHLQRLSNLQSALRSSGERTRLFPGAGDFEREFKDLGVARRGRGRGIIGTGVGIGALLGGIYGGNHAAPESD